MEWFRRAATATAAALEADGGAAADAGERAACLLLQQSLESVREMEAPRQSATVAARDAVSQSGAVSLARAAADAGAARARLWDALHSGEWRATPRVLRRLYVAAATLSAAAELAMAKADLNAAVIAAARRALDVALMLGPPESTGPDSLAQALLADLANHDAGSVAASGRRLRDLANLALPSDADDAVVAASRGGRLARAAAPSFEAFLHGAFVAREPLIIGGAMAHWPALVGARRWSDPA
jgi:[histone H3]-dimethyl/trimethyl-L-lysine36 demethylase